MHGFEKQYAEFAEVLTHHNFPPSIEGNSGLPEWGMTKTLRCVCFGHPPSFCKERKKPPPSKGG